MRGGWNQIGPNIQNFFKYRTNFKLFFLISHDFIDWTTKIAYNINHSNKRRIVSLLPVPNQYIAILLPPETKEILKALVFLRLPHLKSFCSPYNTRIMENLKFSYHVCPLTTAKIFENGGYDTGFPWVFELAFIHIAGV